MKKKRNIFFRCVYGGRGGGLEWVNFFLQRIQIKKRAFCFFVREREREGGGAE